MAVLKVRMRAALDVDLRNRNFLSFSSRSCGTSHITVDEDIFSISKTAPDLIHSTTTTTILLPLLLLNATTII